MESTTIIMKVTAVDLPINTMHRATEDVVYVEIHGMRLQDNTRLPVENMQTEL